MERRSNPAGSTRLASVVRQFTPSRIEHQLLAQVFEFVSLEHTSKNKMILAVKRKAPGGEDQARAQIAQIKAFYGIREHCLETLLGEVA